MEDVKNDIKRQPASDEISLQELILKVKEWYSYFVSHWIIILVTVTIGSVIGIFYAYSKRPTYFAQTTFVLEEEGQGGLGQYAGIASMIGIDIGGGGNGIFQGENIFELYKSRLMIEKTLLSAVEFGGREILLIERYIRSNKLQEAWKQDERLVNIDFSIPKNKFTVAHDSVISVIVKDINKNYLKVDKLDKKLSIISVTVKAEDELFAKAFTDKIVANVNEFYIQTKTKNSLQNVQLLQRQADSVRRVLNSSIGGAASAIDANPNANPALQILRVPSQRKQIDVQASSAIYAEVTKNLEIAKIALRNKTPLIQVIDEPILPLERSQFGKAKGLILGMILAGFFVITLLFFKKILKSS